MHTVIIKLQVDFGQWHQPVLFLTVAGPLLSTHLVVCTDGGGLKEVFGVGGDDVGVSIRVVVLFVVGYGVMMIGTSGVAVGGNIQVARVMLVLGVERA